MSIRAVRLPLLLFAEVLAAYAACAVVAHLFSGGEGAGPSIYSVAAIVVVSFLLGRGLQQTDLEGTGLRAVGVPIAVGFLFAIIHTEYAPGSPPWDFGWLRSLVTDADGLTPSDRGIIGGAVAMTLLFVRGISRGQQPDDFDSALTSVGFGGIAVVIAAAASPETRGGEAWGLVALTYLAAAVGVLAMYRVAEPDRGVADVISRSLGAAGALIAVAAVLALGAAAIDPGAFGFLAPIGEPIGDAAEAVAQAVLGPPLALLSSILDAILPEAGNPPPPDTSVRNTVTPDEDNGTPLWVRIVGYGIAGVSIVFSLLLGLVLLWLAFQRYRRRETVRAERREAIEGESMLLDDLGELFDGFRRRFSRAAGTAPSSIGIRRLYGEMLDHAGSRGVERPISVTPSQFAPQLDESYASSAPSAITDAFVASRYGAHHADDAAVRDLRDRWRQAWDQ